MRRMIEVGHRRRLFVGVGALTTVLMLMAGSMAAHAQSHAGNSGQQARSYEVLHLNGSLTRNGVTDIVVTLRNMVPHARIYVASSQYAISVLGTPDDLTLARKVFNSLNHARPVYQLTYTITETGSGKTASVRKVALRIVSGGKAEAKEGMRVPVAIETAATRLGEANTQYQYVDTGVNINASLDGPAAGSGDTLRLQTRMNLSGLAGTQAASNAQEPRIWNSTINGPVTLTVGKTVALESATVPSAAPGGERHLTITVVAEPAA